MKVNIHPIERLLRLLIGAILLSMVFWGPKSPWFFLGFLPIATGLTGWCPPYSLMGVNTCNLKRKN